MKIGFNSSLNNRFGSTKSIVAPKKKEIEKILLDQTMKQAAKEKDYLTLLMLTLNQLRDIGKVY